MSYADATAFAASLAATLMVEIVVFQAGDGTHAACPAAEFDGDDDMVKLELDPWGKARPRLIPDGLAATSPRPGLQRVAMVAHRRRRNRAAPVREEECGPFDRDGLRVGERGSPAPVME